MMIQKFFSMLMLVASLSFIDAQNTVDPSLLTLDLIYNSDEFNEEQQRPIKWVQNGDAFITIEPSQANDDELIIYNSATQERNIFIPANAIAINGKAMNIESFSLSDDNSKVLLFTNSSRVWRSNTKGDFWVYDLETKKLKQLGTSFEPSSLMFAKFSPNNAFVAYVQNFNIYLEDFKTGKVTQLTFDGNRSIINGTFDWVYEEEFGKRDGFTWSPDGNHIAFWQLDASEIGTHYMINNTDSIYSQMIPLQYPKVGQDPSAAKVGIIDMQTLKTKWVDLPGDQKQNYIPAIQWVKPGYLLIQQMNRKQNQLLVYSYLTSNTSLTKLYTESEDTWVDLSYPDISANNWGQNDLPLIEDNTSFLRLTENDGWRHIHKVNLRSRISVNVTPGNYDVASMGRAVDDVIYYIASPFNNTERYLFQTNNKGNTEPTRITPKTYKGVNTYNISPNGKYAIHHHESVSEPKTSHFINLPDHNILKTLVDNAAYKNALASLKLPEITFSEIKTKEGIPIDVRTVLPVGFDKSKKYPVIFHVYGEPWAQVATNKQVGLWNIMMAQKGYVIIDMDPRGTPSLKGSKWRKSIYRNIGIINALDQASATIEILKLPYLDNKRTAIWGWSGGGSMTLNMMFQYPDIFKTGISIAPVSNQLIYDNIYQERYMGLPQENMEDFVKGSPITYAKNLKGHLLVIHGTADDNVHYQSMELLVNELIKHNKQFDMMSYPNRSHGIWEGENTRRHLYGLMTRYLEEHLR